MIQREVDTILFHVKDIINKYPNALDISLNSSSKGDLSVRLAYKYYDKWCKFLNKEYKFNIINVNIKEDKFRSVYLKRLLQVKKFLKENYK